MWRGWFASVLLLMPRPAAATPNPSVQPAGTLPVQPVRGPALEISGNPAAVDLPAVPSFAIPVAEGGIHTPRELLVSGERLRGSQVQVGGYITWIYDCAAAFVQPGMAHEQVERLIESDPTRCERHKFYLGDARSTPPDRSLWVVDVPRRPFKIEQERMPTDKLVNWPDVPSLTLGAYVVVTGTLALRSPHDEVNSDGLLVYESIDTTRRGPPPASTTPSPETVLPAVPTRTAPPASPIPASAGDSIRHANAAARAYASKQYDTAIAEYQAAVAAWSGNHDAWYGLAGARSQRGNYQAAAEAAERAVALVPDQAMYWLLYGRLLYEAALDDAKNRAARAQGCPADQAVVDRATIDATPALEALLAAASLENRLWRAHYYIGRILRDRGDARGAATRFTEAIAQHAWDPNPYIALCELYRRWWYRDEALAIATVGAAAIPASAEIWYELGRTRDDRGQGRAIEAYTRALELKPRLDQARFQRGQAYFRRKDFAHARRDLEAFVHAGGTGFATDQARRMLADIPR